MAVIHLVHNHGTHDIVAFPEETLLETLRRNNISLSSILLTDKDHNFLSVKTKASDIMEAWAYALRNLDHKIIDPTYSLVPAQEPVTEFFLPLHNPKNLALVQFDRARTFDYIYDRFKAVLDSYRYDAQQNGVKDEIQVSLSAGGDSRLIAECLHRYKNENPASSFVCLTIDVGIEDGTQLQINSAKIAADFGLTHSYYDARAAASLLKQTHDLRSIQKEYRKDYPDDEPEVLGTYWLQEINFAVARQEGRHGIIFGYNQEDAVADRLYQMMVGKLLPSYPVRRLDEFDIIAPVSQIPKRLLDSLDMKNSLRNYRQREASVSYLRSSLYFMAYLIGERFPSIAEAIAGSPLRGNNPDSIKEWLEKR